jgi:hypothetical protein
LTRYLHLFCGNSPVLAACATTLLVLTCIDRRLGRAALCGSLAGMSGGHLTPDLSAVVALAGLTSIAYELLINMGNACRGVGGRLGAAAFLAMSALAKYQGVRCVGRKLRRGLWRSGAGPSSILASMILYHMLGAVATTLLRESSNDSAAVGTLKDGYLRNVPLPRVPQIQSASHDTSHELIAPKAGITIPGYLHVPSWIPSLPKIGSIHGFSQRLL